MKKNSVLLLMIMLLLIFNNSFALSTNLSVLSMEELVRLRSDINAEISARTSVDPVMLAPFEYRVGAHLPAGWYKVTGMVTNSEDVSYVGVFENEDNLKKYTGFDSYNNFKEYSLFSAVLGAVDDSGGDI